MPRENHRGPTLNSPNQENRNQFQILFKRVLLVGTLFKLTVKQIRYELYDNSK